MNDTQNHLHSALEHLRQIGQGPDVSRKTHQLVEHAVSMLIEAWSDSCGRFARSPLLTFEATAACLAFKARRASPPNDQSNEA